MNEKSIKRGFGFYFRIYFKIIAQDIKSKMSYREDFIISMLGMVITNIAGFVTFWIMFQNFPTIAGWSYYEILFLYGFSLLSITPTQCLFDNNWNLSRSLYTGEFIKYCFRPINIFFYFISEVFDTKGLGQLVFGTITLVYAWNKLALPVTAFNIAMLIIGTVTASLFMIALMNLAASTGFWLIGGPTMVMIFAFRFKDYARYPITVFGPICRFVFTYVIPIAFMAYYPSLILIRPDSVPLLTYLSPLIGVAFVYVSYKVWMKGALSYSGTGS